MKIRKVTGTAWVEVDDQLAIEEPLEIQLRTGDQIQKSISVTMRTPGHDEALAVGFLFTEGILQNSGQIQQVKSDAENTVLVCLTENVNPSIQKAERNFYTTSSCGVCGKSSIDAIRTVSAYQNSRDSILIDASQFYSLQEAIRKQQIIFASTGGLHASALFDLDGNVLLLCEDVGRHNALDKVIGTALLNNQVPLTNTILLLSGRASFELIQKASMAGIKIVAAIGAPSTLAVQLAEEFGMTLFGFLRGERFNV